MNQLSNKREVKIEDNFDITTAALVLVHSFIMQIS